MNSLPEEKINCNCCLRDNQELVQFKRTNVSLCEPCLSNIPDTILDILMQPRYNAADAVELHDKLTAWNLGDKALNLTSYRP